MVEKKKKPNTEKHVPLCSPQLRYLHMLHHWVVLFAQFQVTIKYYIFDFWRNWPKCMKHVTSLKVIRLHFKLSLYIYPADRVKYSFQMSISGDNTYIRVWRHDKCPLNIHITVLPKHHFFIMPFLFPNVFLCCKWSLRFFFPLEET